MEFTLIKSRAITLSRSPQSRAFSRAVMDEKSLSPLFPVGGGGGGGQWLQMTGCINYVLFYDAREIFDGTLKII